MECDVTCIFQWFLFILTTFGFVFYILSLIVLLKRRDVLNGSFFKLLTSLGFADIIWFIINISAMRVPIFMWNFFPSSRKIIGSVWFNTLKQMSQWSIYYSQVFGVVNLSVNRLTALCWLNEVEHIWSGKLFKFAIGFQWSWVFPFTLPQLHPYCSSYLHDNISLLTQFEHPEVSYWMWTADVVVEVCIVAPLLIIIHIIMFTKAHKYSTMVAPASASTIQNPSNSNTWSMELKFAVLGTILCSCYLVMVANWAFAWFYGHYINSFHSLFAKTFLPLIFVMANPFLLFAFSTQFRHNFCDMYFKC